MSKRTSTCQQRLQRYLKFMSSHGIYTAKDFCHLDDTSIHAVRHTLTDMADEGLIFFIGTERSIKYYSRNSKARIPLSGLTNSLPLPAPDPLLLALFPHLKAA